MALRDILLGGSANRQTIIHFPNGEHEDIDSGIYSGSMKINRILCNSSNLQYGECNAASFQAQISNISDLSGVKIYVYQKIDTEIFPLFTGIVDSCKAVRNKSYRKLVAYDEIYSVSSRNVVNWYNDLFENNTSYTLKQFRNSFFSYIGIEQENTELINDAITIEKTIQTDSLKAGDVMYAICQINACFGNVTPEGKFRYVDLDAGETYDVSDNLKSTTSYEEYVTKTIDKLMVLSDEDELNVTVGSGDNTYAIKGNFLIYGYETETLRTVAGRIFQKIRYMSYRPADIKTIISEINIQLGDKIIVTDNNIEFVTYVLKESFSGAQLLTQTIQADGEEEYADVINDVNGDIRELKLKQSTILSSLQTEYLKAATAELTYIKSSELTTIEANIKNAVIGSLSTEFATVKYLETNYAKINLANVEKATIGTVLANVGLITNATIVDGHVTGYLDSVNINANRITAGDLSVERLIMRGSENSVVYALNNITGALQAQNVDTINGEVLTQRTVTADRLVAKSITANEIATKTITAASGIIADAAITTANIADLAVTSAKIASLDAAKITTGTLDAARIAANSITANKIAVADFINYATVNENFPDTNIPINAQGGASISDGYIIKTTISKSYLIFCDFTPCNLKNGEQIYYEMSIKGAVSGNVTPVILYYDSSKKYVSGTQATNHAFTITETIISGTITLSSAADTAVYFLVGIRDDSLQRNQIYVREVRFIRKNGGNLIVDGAITANKIAANAITADKLNVTSLGAITANLGTVTAGTINMSNVNEKSAYITYKDTNGYYNNIGAYGMDLSAERTATTVHAGYITMQLNDSESAIAMTRYATDYTTDIAPGWGIFSHRLSVGGYNDASYALSATSIIAQSIRTTSGANLDTINISYPVKYIKKTYTNLSGWTTGTVNYKTLDTFAALGVPSGKKVVSLNVIGWSGAPGMFNVIQNSAGTAPVLMCTGTGTFTSITIEIAYQ